MPHFQPRSATPKGVPFERTHIHTVVVVTTPVPEKGEVRSDAASFYVDADARIHEVRGTDVQPEFEGELLAQDAVVVLVGVGNKGVTTRQTDRVIDVVDYIQRTVVQHGVDVVTAGEVSEAGSDKEADKIVKAVRETLQRGGGRDAGASPRRVPADAEALPPTGTLANKEGVNIPPGGTYPTDVKPNKR